MRVERLHDVDDPRLAEYHGVPDPELVRARGLFVAEGRFVVQRLIDAGRHAVASVLVNEAAFASLASSWARLPPDVPVYVCEADGFRRLTGFNIHRGCLAIARRPEAIAVGALIAGARRVVVALEQVANADNVGGVFRNAAAFGVDGVVLSPGCCDPFYRKAIRTSMGAALTLPFASDESWPASLARLREAGFTVAALTPRGDGVDLAAFARDRARSKLAIVLGAEGAGLTPAAEAAAGVRLRIPIQREIDSLNVAVAAGIALYALKNV
jgi:tRNA G18 (ribose-2'-O)-methylase SpoU